MATYFAGGFSVALGAPAPRVRHRPLRPREHGPGGLVDGARRSPRMTDLKGDQISRLAHTRSDPDSVRAAVVDLAEPEHAARRPRRLRSRSVRCLCSGLPASTSARREGESASHSRTSSTRQTGWLALNEFHPVALATPAAAVSRSGTSTRTACCRLSHSLSLPARGKEEIPLVARRLSESGTRSRASAGPARPPRSQQQVRPGRAIAIARRDPALQRQAKSTSTVATARSAAPPAGILETVVTRPGRLFGRRRSTGR